ncbi:MAG: hypothetical protein AAGF59_12050 [Pseudomonadota bacterium]
MFTGLAILVLTIALVWGAYFLARWLLLRFVDDRTSELAGSVIFRVSALHGLILALVFAQEMIEYQELERGLTAEATAVADIYYDIGRFGGDSVDPIQTALTRYARTVVTEEWQSLTENKRLSSDAWQARETVYEALLDLPADTPRQASLRDHMLDKVRGIAEYRQARESHAASSINVMFWIAAVGGVVLVAFSFFCFPARPVNLLLLTIFAAFTGIVMQVIYAFSDPFAPPGALQPTAFERLLDGDIGSHRGG